MGKKSRKNKNNKGGKNMDYVNGTAAVKMDKWPETPKKEQAYTYCGNLNQTEVADDFIKICKMKQSELKLYVQEMLKGYYPEVMTGDGYVYAKGTTPVLLTAHLDTVHKEPVKDFYEDIYLTDGDIEVHEISSPQGIGGDDRCGVYMIESILCMTEHRPSVLFCEDEEIGGVGSEKFCLTPLIDDLNEMKFLIELDRANANDLVFYGDDNTEFHKWCEDITGYTEAYGSFSDISNLAPECGVSAVNISCGYYGAHTLEESVVWEEMWQSTWAAIDLLDASETVDQFKYITRPRYSYSTYSSYYNRGWDDWYDDYKYTPKVSDYANEHVSTNEGKVMLYVEYFSKTEQKTTWATVVGETENECWGNFFLNHGDVCFYDVVDYDVM